MPPIHSHSLNDITGYVVVKTIDDAGIAASDRDGWSPVVSVVDGASNYLQALGIAKSHRTGKGYAVVRDLHGCEECDAIVLSGREPHTVQLARYKAAAGL